jgi:hypothetical protein
MTEHELLQQIWGHVQIMNREMGEVQASLAILWKIILLVLAALVINAGVAVYRSRNKK